MVLEYKNGKDFILDNKEFLDENKYMSVFFYLDAKILNEVSKENFAIKVENNNKKLLAIKVNPYNLLLYGDKSNTIELLEYLNRNNFIYDGIMCQTDIGDIILDKNKEYYKTIGMDFMEAKEITFSSSNEVIIATISDLDEIYNLSCSFFKDCGLPDIPNKDKMKDIINNYRVIKKDNKIVSMAAFSKDTENSYRITHVYTRPLYRGLGYSKMVVNTLKNEIINNGKIATLNVDQNNPISYHIYDSLGFKKIFSQGIYLRRK